MANKKAGVAFLIMFFVIVAVLGWQINNYLQAQERAKIVDAKISAAEDHFRIAKETADNYLASNK